MTWHCHCKCLCWALPLLYQGNIVPRKYAPHRILAQISRIKELRTFSLPTPTISFCCCSWWCSTFSALVSWFSINASATSMLTSKPEFLPRVTISTTTAKSSASMPSKFLPKTQSGHNFFQAYSCSCKLHTNRLCQWELTMKDTKMMFPEVFFFLPNSQSIFEKGFSVELLKVWNVLLIHWLDSRSPVMRLQFQCNEI